MSKLDKMSRYIPGLYKPQTNTNVRGLLYAWSSEDDLIVSAAQAAKDQIFVKTAELQYLDALGSNVGVFRPAPVNLSDDSFRELIPALSFRPKQVRSTIVRVLEVFFGVGNPRVSVNEINPNEIVIQIPSSVPSLRRNLKGALHFHNYSGQITAIDNIGKTMTVNVEGNGLKFLVESELKGGTIGQGMYSLPILDNSVGVSNVTIQFSASADLSNFQIGRWRGTNPRYPGAYLADPRRAYTVTKNRGILGANIVAGNIVPILAMQDASGVPDAAGLVVFDFGMNEEEALVKYFGRPNNSTLLLDPSYTFSHNHSIGSAVNVIVKPYQKPSIDGIDYSAYLVGVTASRLLAQQIIESIAAAGIVIRWVVVEPRCLL